MNTTTHDLTRLSQTQIAWLIGRPTHWIRQNSHRIPRNQDGSYNAAAVVEIMLREFAAPVIDPEFSAMSISELLDQYQQKPSAKRGKRGTR